MFGNKIESDRNDLKRNRAGDHVARTQKREPPKIQEILIGDILANEKLSPQFGVWNLACLVIDLGNVSLYCFKACISPARNV